MAIEEERQRGQSLQYPPKGKCGVCVCVGGGGGGGGGGGWMCVCRCAFVGMGVEGPII